MRRALLALLVAAAVAAPAAFGRDDGPVVDVVEIAGVIDRPLARYATERIEGAEREGVALLVFQVDSLGGVKVSDDDPLPPLVRRIRDARVPVAVYVGPRGARGAGMIVPMMAAADHAAMSPSARIGPALPFDAARPTTSDHRRALIQLLGATSPPAAWDGMGLVRLGDMGRVRFPQVAQPTLADFLRWIDGGRARVPGGIVRLELPSDEVVVRFHQPGPIRRMLHTFANPALLYLLLLGGALLVAFELFQPGFGVAGVTGALLLAAAAYGLTVLPARGWGLAVLAGGLGLCTLDVALDRLGPPTLGGTAAIASGSLGFLPGSPPQLRLSPWLVGLGVGACLVFFVPVLTVVRRARTPVGATERRRLVGEEGRVRSMLNPEGFVWVEDQVWRARTEDGRRMRVGEGVVVTAVQGTVLIVRPGTAAGA